MNNPGSPEGNQSALDLSAALTLARGERQRRWLDALLDAENGLRPGDGASGKWAKSVYDRVATFVWALRMGGYIIEKRPFGRQRILRFSLVGFSPAYGVVAQMWSAGVRDAIDENGMAHPVLMALTEPQLKIALALASRVMLAPDFGAIARCFDDCQTGPSPSR